MIDALSAIEQQDLEIEMSEAGIARFARQIESQFLCQTKPGKDFVADVSVDVLDVMERWTADWVTGKNLRRGCTYWGPLMASLDLPRVAVIAIGQSVDWIHRRGPLPFQTLAGLLSDALKNDMTLEDMKEKDKTFVRRFELRTRGLWTARRLRRALQTLPECRKAWSSVQRAHLGCFLVSALVEAGILLVTHSYRRGKTTCMVRLAASVVHRIKEHSAKLEHLRPAMWPMVIPPKDHGPTEKGGYTWLSFWHTKSGNLPHDPACFEAINALQKTAWRVNRVVEHFMRDILDHSYHLPPEVMKSLGIPPAEPTPMLKETKPFPKQGTKEEQKAWLDESKIIYDQNREDENERRTWATALSQAEKFSNFHRIYFPHQFDFRGRMYPVSYPLSPQGPDHVRALLEFDEAEPWSPEGDKWARINLANLYGVKGTNRDKRGWFREHETRLRNWEIKLNVLQDTQWWSEADKPWQFFAAVQDWIHAPKHGFRFPVQLDGSNSGLQHYSAMLRDLIGARLTNLIYSEQPEDIYLHIAGQLATRVEMKCQSLQLSLSPASQSEHPAFWWRGNITRDVCKRGTMTYVYGVTPQGVQGYLKTDGHCDGMPSRYEAAKFLMPMYWDVLKTSVTAASEAMDWLRQVAKVSAQDNKALEWRAPDGFRVRQEYMAPDYVTVDTMHHRIRFKVPGDEKISAYRQKNSLPPNYVHSMDAAHMRDVIRRMSPLTGSLSMIHDSFGVHPSKAGEMRDIILRAFYDQYSGNALDDFARQVRDLGLTIPDPPRQGDWDPQHILSAEHAFA